MSIYAVEFRRDQYATIHVEADDVKSAQEDACELLYDGDWDTDTESVEDVYEIGRRFKGKYWSGGPDGDWVNA
jgi:hypothetical protein